MTSSHYNQCIPQHVSENPLHYIYDTTTPSTLIYSPQKRGPKHPYHTTSVHFTSKYSVQRKQVADGKAIVPSLKNVYEI